MQALTQNMENPAQQNINRSQRLGIENASTSRDYSSTWAAAGRNTSGWAELEALYNMTGGDISATHETNRIRRAIPVISDVWSDDVSGFRRAYGRIGNREHQQHADDTAGLTWSEDGRAL
jgi:hypothetical protein